jgi:hypothetical protein
MLNKERPQGGPMTDKEGDKSMEVEALRMEVEKHVEQNTLAAVAGEKCVDGGYKPGEAEGKLARPGGSLGVSMTLLELGYSPEESFRIVYDFNVEQGLKYGWHTDTHADPEDGHKHDDTIVGCGHCEKAIKVAQSYSDTVSGEAFNELLTIVRNAQADPELNKNMEMVKLDRKHEEGAILAILDEDKTVRPWDLETNKQFFIYDIARDKKLFNKLVYFMAEKGLIEDDARETVFSHLWTEGEKVEDQGIVQQQTNATLSLLGTSQGADIFGVSWDEDGKASIKHIGNAPGQRKQA